MSEIKRKWSGVEMEVDISQVRDTFITESAEILHSIEDSLLRLERSPGDADLINSLFRSAHTIKGSSGIVGLEKVEKFTHIVENLLSRMRDGEIAATAEITGLLLECRDHIRDLIDHSSCEGHMPAEMAKREEALSARLTRFLGAPAVEARQTVATAPEAAAPSGKLAQTAAWHISVRFSPDVLRQGMDPIGCLSYLSRIGEIVSLSALFDSMPPADGMDPETCYLGLEIDFKSEFGKKDIEDVFEFVREGSVIHILPPNSMVASYVELINNLPEDTSLLGEILIKGGVLTRGELEEALSCQSGTQSGPENRPRIGEILVEKGMVHPEVVDAALEKQKKVNEVKSREASTIRIDSSKLDKLINLVGELVISSANIGQHAHRLKDPVLFESASVMLRLVEEVRDNTMKARMVPIGETFGRFNRVVRDIGKELGKEIDLAVSGGDTELDKNVVEKIADPLMHLVRNAADHGLEGPEERKANGKSSTGTVRLNAYHDAGFIVIEVSDDGKGLCREKILNKALAAGLIAQGQQLQDHELYKLIFEPGFSTAEKVTKLSGRGVGMDVVKKNIEALRGTVDVESREGSGTTVRIRLPLTLAIIDGFQVGVEKTSYVIPLDMVVECVEFSDEDRRMSDKRSYINLRGEVLPYIRLRNYFGVSGPAGRFENIVIVKYAGQKVGLVVDELNGEVQTVIKSLGKVYRDVRGISGAAIMGNGRVALILDIPRLLQSVEEAYRMAV